jgi:ABC-type glycerol-3-phosphate transport system substrate-binding protein
MEAPALFYRPEEFKKAGLRPEDCLAGPEGFLDACGRLAGRGHKRGYFPVLHSGSRFSASYALPFIWNRGGDLFSPDMNRCTLSKDEAVRGLEDYLEPAVRGHLPLFDGALLDGGPFYEESAAMVIGTRVPASAGRRSGFQPARLPGERKREQVLCSCLAAASGSRSLKESGAFLKWALTAENCRSFASGFGVFPCHGQALTETLDASRSGGFWREIFSSPAASPAAAVYPTAELLLDKALWRASLRIARQSYGREDLLRELILAQSEIDYLLSLY